MRFPRILSFLPLSFSALLCLASCDKACEKDEKPQLHLSASQWEWANPYAQGTTWRFRNAAGYERSYRIKEFKDEMLGTGGGKSSFCSSMYYQTVRAEIERTDTAQTIGHRFSMTASSNYRDASFGSSFTWGGNNFSLPIAEVEAGTTPANYGAGSSARVLPQLVVGSRTYQNVVETTLTSLFTGGLAPSSTVRVFITKADGPIRFETKAGTVWDRQ